MKEAQVFCPNIIKHNLFITLYLIAMPIAAIDTGVLDVGAITGKGWKLEGVKFSLNGFNQKQSQLKFSADKLVLPKPFHDLALADIRCADFTWAKDQLKCNQGRASVRSAYWQSPNAKFSFHLSQKLNSLNVQDARFLGSRLSLIGVNKGKNWQVNFSVKHIDHYLAEKLLQVKALKPKSANLAQAQKKQGNLNLSGIISGKQNTVQAFNVMAEVAGLTDQTEDGKVASERLNLLIHLEGNKTRGDSWGWRSQSKLLGGALYVDPVYLEAGSQPITLNANGLWNNLTRIADIIGFTYKHPEAGELAGSGKVYFRYGVKVDKAEVTLQSETLQVLLNTYINPFFTESPLTGMTATGDLLAKFAFTKQTISGASVNFSRLHVNDEAGRLAIKDGNGMINWSDNPAQAKESKLAWQQLTIKDLPLEQAKLRFISKANQINLADKAKVPVLNGSIVIDKFSWQGKQQGEPDVSFVGSLENVSLEKLSKTLGWTALSGNISGKIPGVNYHDKILSLDGELLVNVFDGSIRINHLKYLGLFSDFPKLSGNINIENLDLDQLTRKFEFGNITGKLSGFINMLELENWRPVTFFAWFGTPDDDESSHRISQKAVKNIASIGGGGASDLLSRSFLGFFETFGYDKIGVGCYLHNGVCQMMGLEAAGQGYYLIKGGGLPRIDVLGYNTQVNWDVLVERLSRVASPDNMVVE